MGSTTSDTTKSTFPPQMVFQKSWRTYQARLLEKLDSYLDDRRLHVVAAPGSGKTVLGLEAIRRINQPTLVLAPTLTIRNQWVERLVDHFLPAGSPKPSWVSTDLRQPALLTVTTYQALHSLCSGEIAKAEEPVTEEENGKTAAERGNANGEQNVKPGSGLQFPDCLRDAHFKTLAVDEAHHLRTEWWRTLTFVVEKLDEPTIVALTATPPYDVSPFEWQRYEELCGPIDAEVSVPELVLQGDLCPHQDYVYFSAPAAKELQHLADFRAAIDVLVRRLKASQEFSLAILAHAFVRSPDLHVEEILEDPEYLSSMVVFLHGVGVEVPRDVLETLGITRERIPALSLEWLEVLLTHCLYSDAERFPSIEEFLKSIRHDLLLLGAIERRHVMLREPVDHTRLLTSSITKLQSIEEIVRMEGGAQADDLRCVVLTDFIRKAELPRDAADQAIFEDIGVVPIFETLRRAAISNIRLGVLSGSLVIVPISCEKSLRKSAAMIGIRPDDLTLTPLSHDPDYISLGLIGEHHQGSVRLLTSVFEDGGITVLVGTKSLLGEGWDAPTVNTLILASFVGSYMLSNQMRGRSIRIDPRLPGKTANIWHLVCVEPGVFGPGADYALLQRRCGAFAGVSAVAPVIENGTDRLGLRHPPYIREQIAEMNATTRSRALDRDGLRRAWQDALASGSVKKMTDGLKVEDEAVPGGFTIANTIMAILIQAGANALAMFYAYLNMLPSMKSRSEFIGYALIIALVIGVNSVSALSIALWRFLRHGTPERRIRHIGRTVLESLIYEGSIRQAEGSFRVYADRNPDGSVYCWIGGGTGREQAIYLRTLREVLRPIDNPRYLLSRKRILRFFREDYFAVPDLMARRKEYAEFFARQWNRRVEFADLVYTRTPEGRKVLLRARMNSFAAAFQDRSERVSCWK